MAGEASMKALAIEGFDVPPAVIEVPVPTAGPGEVLVRVRAASVNAYDTVVAMGMMKDYMPYEFPAVVGMDVAGVVEDVGDGAEGFAPGLRVFGTLGMKGSVHDGSFAELATPQAQSLAIAPDDLDDVQAGSLGVAGTTAMGGVEALDPSPGDVVLVLGATGGVGTFAMQLASSRGAHVIASVRPGDEPFVRDLGAAETVDYTGDVAAAIRERHPDGIAGLIDLVHRDHAGFAEMTGLVRNGGRAASAVGGAGDATEIAGVAVSNVGGNPAQLGPLGNLVVAGSVRAAVSRTYRLDDGAQALHDFANQHTLGKLVITMP
jgi:NADPH:quinone reductase-like Zn-dependent oxidoreductase